MCAGRPFGGGDGVKKHQVNFKNPDCGATISHCSSSISLGNDVFLWLNHCFYKLNFTAV